MKIYLAGVECKLTNQRIIERIYSKSGEISVLGSFFGIRQRGLKRYAYLMPNFKDFMLDSGAFSFMNSNSVKEDWRDYIEQYASFINENRVEKFFELDIDSLVGYEKVKEYRMLLERKVNRQSIPVWHRTRGAEEFFRLCEEYRYISIGGIAIKHISSSEYKYFPYLINEAHKRGCKIHALGFTDLGKLKKYHFDSVDSSSWSSGSRYGTTYRFKDGRMESKKRKKSRRVLDWRGLDEFNFGEWVKFQKYAEVHL